MGGEVRSNDFGSAIDRRLRQYALGKSKRSQSVFNCPRCNQSFNSDADYKVHYKKEHTKKCC